MRIASATLDDGAVTIKPKLHSSRAIIYGDSITEGVNAQLYDFTSESCSRTGLLDAAAAPMSWAARFAEGVAAEVSNIAFAAQGYVTPNSVNYGNVPPLFVPVKGSGEGHASHVGHGSSRGGGGGGVGGAGAGAGAGAGSESAWDKIDSTHSRLPALKARPPEYVVSAEGFNDQVCSGWAGYTCTNADIAASVTGWIGAVRNATSPGTRVIVLAPFGGEMRTQNRTRFAIRDGVAAYEAAHPSDKNVYFIDVYPRAQRGLKGATALGSLPNQSSGQPPGPTAESCDGTHPLGWKHAELAAMITAEVARQVPSAVFDHRAEL